MVINSRYSLLSNAGHSRDFRNLFSLQLSHKFHENLPSLFCMSELGIHSLRGISNNLQFSANSSGRFLHGFDF
jgi:hypothetical protein